MSTTQIATTADTLGLLVIFDPQEIRRRLAAVRCAEVLGIDPSETTFLIRAIRRGRSSGSHAQSFLHPYPIPRVIS